MPNTGKFFYASIDTLKAKYKRSNFNSNNEAIFANELPMFRYIALSLI